MKEKFAIAIVVVCLLLSFSCGKKQSEKKQETSGNPVEQYGDVMSKTIKRAKGMDAVLPVKQLIDSFYVQEGRYPSSLQELVEKNYVKEIPQPPKGYTYSYEPSSGRIELKPAN